ncbi:MAG: gamma-glutamyl-gamma-aminobutyrate hydrolase family protein [Patescibacteria group bacterium]|nr:gamma-glutamyl-gamma-aminobutyrate hydrolase family protein [Patescibacteria group bacterium]
MNRALVPMSRLELVKQSIAPLNFARETFIKKLLRYNVVPVFVSSLFPKEMVEKLYNECQGIFCMGGADFNSNVYGEEPHLKTEATEPLRDELELHLIRKALADKKPFLGICRGCQALAIASGGTLYQHIEGIALGENHGASEGGTYEDLVKQVGHEVVVAEGSKARALLGKEIIRTNSGHHQAVKSVGEGIIVSGKTKGGITEIIEHTAQDFFCFGIQAHPEVEDNGDCEPFFRAFADAMSQRG